MSEIEKKIKRNELLSKYTHFRIGGPADYLLIAESSDEIIEGYKWAQEKHLPVTILGGGSNVLVLDKGIRGLVIKTENKKYKIEGTTVTAESGVVLMNLVNILADRGLSGLEFGCGIFGTVGGAIRGNAGSFGGEIKDILLQVEVYKSNIGKTILSVQDMDFSYRHSVIADHKDWVILSGIFELKKDNVAKVKARVKEMLTKKISTQPMDKPSSGCIFKNPILDKEKFQELQRHFGKDLPDSFWQSNSIGAGFLIQSCGLKGKIIGDAMISNKHATFIVNKGKATAENVLMLISYIKQQIRDKYGVQLQEEIEILGE